MAGDPGGCPSREQACVYSAGYVLFSSSGDLLAQKFDADRLELSGPAVVLARRIEYNTYFHNGAFTASETGILVYAPKGTGVNSKLVWVDRDGKDWESLVNLRIS